MSGASPALPARRAAATFVVPQARGAGAYESRQDREGSSGKFVKVATVRLGFLALSPHHRLR